MLPEMDERVSKISEAAPLTPARALRNEARNLEQADPIEAVREVLERVTSAAIGAAASSLRRKGGASVSFGTADAKETKRPRLAPPHAEDGDNTRDDQQGSNGVFARRGGDHVRADLCAEAGTQCTRG